MSTIKVSDLQPVGSNLFSDSESFMDHLSDSELDNTTGGFQNGCFPDTFTNPPNPYPFPNPYPDPYPDPLPWDFGS